MQGTLSSSYTRELIDYLQERTFPSIFQVGDDHGTGDCFPDFKSFGRKIWEEARERIYVTTTIGKGALYGIAVENAEMFGISEDIGGRYSVLTPVGLCPSQLRASMSERFWKELLPRGKTRHKPYLENDALLYAALRNLFYRRGKTVELLASYEPKLRYFGEWYKQLLGIRGRMARACSCKRPLHHRSPFPWPICPGRRKNSFETVINFEKPEKDMVLIREEEDFDGLNYLAGKSLDYVNRQALKGTVLAHVDGDVPNLLLNFPEISARQFGRMVYFFMFACGVSGYLLGVNPFNQEGVEAYKRNMFTLLGKP